MRSLVLALAALCLPALSQAAVTVTGTLCSGARASVSITRYNSTGGQIGRTTVKGYTAGVFSESLEAGADGSRYTVSIQCPTGSATTEYWLIPDVAGPVTTAQVSVGSTVRVGPYYWDTTNSAWASVAAGVSGGGGSGSPGGTNGQIQYNNAGSFGGLTSIGGTRLGNPAVGTKGGVEAKACGGTDKVSAIGTDGVPVCTTDQTGGGVQQVAQIKTACLAGAATGNASHTSTASAYPAAKCLGGTNAFLAEYVFSMGASQAMQVPFIATGTGSMTVRGVSRTAVTSGNYTFSFKTAKSSDTESLDPAFGSATNATITAEGTTNRASTWSVTVPMPSGAVAGDLVILQLSWVPGSNTIAADSCGVTEGCTGLIGAVVTQ